MVLRNHLVFLCIIVSYSIFDTGKDLDLVMIL